MIETSIAAQRAAVIAAAQSFVGTPFHHQGRLRGVGVDCAYLLEECFRPVLGWPRMDFGYYAIDYFLNAADDRYRQKLADLCVPVKTPDAGDIALVHFGRAFAHGAIAIAWPRLIHAHWKNGVEYANAEQGKLRGRDMLFYSPKEWHA